MASTIRTVTFTSLAVVLLMAPSPGTAFDFQFVSATSNTACINFRGDFTSSWAYLAPSGITPRSAERFCRTYFPTAITGTLTATDSSCYVSGGSYRYTNTVDCPNKDAPFDNCTVTGSTLPSYFSSNYYAAGIKCIIDSNWSNYSSFSSNTTSLSTKGAFGTQVNRSILVARVFNFDSVRPDPAFSSGTICLPENVTEKPGSNLAQALCRTAGLPASSSSTVVNKASTNSTSYPVYMSQIQCSNSSTATLWNGGCNTTTHFYDTPTSGCSPHLPEVSCPTTFDFKLSDPIVSSDSDNGFHVVQLRQAGTDAFDGMMCVHSAYAKNFANVMCREMYGDDVDFAVAYTSHGTALPSGTREFLSSVRCTSSAFTTLSQCDATLTSEPSSQPPCSKYRGIVSCKLNHNNVVFSITKDTSTTTPGKGYLMATVSAAGQTSPGAVCTNGFDQTAAIAACRSIGYAPGPNVSFSLATAVSTHAINKVTCPLGASNLSDCKLQYSGAGYKIPYSSRQVCSGRVYLDCDLGAPSVEFRTSSSYLQARLYPNAEWGWVDVGGGVTFKTGYNAMCLNSTTNNINANASKTFLSISYCSTSASSYADCTYEYTNGVPGTRDFHCSRSNIASTTTQFPLFNQGMVDSEGSGDSSNVVIGAAVGASVAFVLVLSICVCVVFKCGKSSDDPPSNSEEVEMPNQPQLTVPSYPPTRAPLDEVAPPAASRYPDAVYGQPVIGTPYPTYGDAPSYSPSDENCNKSTLSPYGRGQYHK